MFNPVRPSFCSDEIQMHDRMFVQAINKVENLEELIDLCLENDEELESLRRIGEAVENSRVDVNMCSEKNGTLLAFAALRGYDRVVEYLLANGADPSVKISDIGTALNLACIKGNLKIAQQLVLAQSHMNKEELYEQHFNEDISKIGAASFLFAYLSANDSLVKFLLDMGVNPDSIIDPKAILAATKLKKEPKVCLSAILPLLKMRDIEDELLGPKQGDVEVEILHDEDMEQIKTVDSPLEQLMVACVAALTEADCMQKIDDAATQADFDVNYYSEKYGTLLVFAVHRGFIDLIKHLFELGANPNIEIDEIGTLLIYAAKKNQREIVNMLASHPGVQNSGSEYEAIIKEVASFSLWDIDLSTLDECKKTLPPSKEVVQFLRILLPKLNEEEGHVKIAFNIIYQKLNEKHLEPCIYRKILLGNLPKLISFLKSTNLTLQGYAAQILSKIIFYETSALEIVCQNDTIPAIIALIEKITDPAILKKDDADMVKYKFKVLENLFFISSELTEKRYECRFKFFNPAFFEIIGNLLSDHGSKLTLNHMTAISKFFRHYTEDLTEGSNDFSKQNIIQLFSFLETDNELIIDNIMCTFSRLACFKEYRIIFSDSKKLDYWAEFILKEDDLTQEAAINFFKNLTKDIEFPEQILDSDILSHILEFLKVDLLKYECLVSIFTIIENLILTSSPLVVNKIFKLGIMPQIIRVFKNYDGKQVDELSDVTYWLLIRLFDLSSIPQRIELINSLYAEDAMPLLCQYILDTYLNPNDLFYIIFGLHTFLTMFEIPTLNDCYSKSETKRHNAKIALFLEAMLDCARTVIQARFLPEHRKEMVILYRTMFICAIRLDKRDDLNKIMLDLTGFVENKQKMQSIESSKPIPIFPENFELSKQRIAIEALVELDSEFHRPFVFQVIEGIIQRDFFHFLIKFIDINKDDDVLGDAEFSGQSKSISTIFSMFKYGSKEQREVIQQGVTKTQAAIILDQLFQSLKKEEILNAEKERKLIEDDEKSIILEHEKSKKSMQKAKGKGVNKSSKKLKAVGKGKENHPTDKDSANGKVNHSISQTALAAPPVEIIQKSPTTKLTTEVKCHPRCKRWLGDISEIPGFLDWVDGKCVRKYERMDISELMYMKRRHELFGLHTLLDPENEGVLYIKIGETYVFFVDSFAGQEDAGRIQESGFVEIAMDKDNHYVYHMFFTPFSDSRIERPIDIDFSPTKDTPDTSDWTIPRHYEFDELDNGGKAFTYKSGNRILVHPLQSRKEDVAKLPIDAIRKHSTPNTSKTS